ncbi:hypothetical protein ACQ4M3_13545 [Leptolyngbya sp. AN03gr2]
MQSQKQQLVESEDLLVSLSEEEQDSIQGGAVPLVIALSIAAARVAAPHVARAVIRNKTVRRGAAVAGGSVIAGFGGAAGADAYEAVKGAVR